MPTYVYKCEDCQSEFEAFASIQKKESGWKPDCPRCGSSKTVQSFRQAALWVRSSSTPSLVSGSCCSRPRGDR
ncbi:MAG: FmdB family transcriptional regulator [Anaerolineae bacterium]|nr:MAG: FmdB family transcriptional regulator [Anaerolineae bacterium]